MSFQAIMYLLLFHFALIGVQGSSYYAILNGTNDDTSLLNHNTNVGKLPDCAKRCEEEQCASFTFNQVVQKRYDGSQSFNRDWNEYKNGFGDPYGEYWIGLEAMHQLIARSPHALLIILESWAGVMKHALYDQFYLASKTDHYRLNVSGYSGTAGHGLIPGLFRTMEPKCQGEQYAKV
ncbi:Angiopoietin-related protein 6 [Mizuhopecten yessoensis]|uniref:Angiopoietin-related protein 6 n=1 Tax=Mizuhopecten yessoensis TaxID=6573 RepID=A0A210PTY6_MIZYE|nr:Angiopoietin-related protein 6 [Mizuhopecten yessoensis]